MQFGRGTYTKNAQRLDNQLAQKWLTLDIVGGQIIADESVG